MTIQDLQIYRMEEIRDEINDLMDEAEAIVASTDDQDIADKAGNWLKVIRKNVHNSGDILTVQTTIDELWFEWNMLRSKWYMVGENE